MTLVVCLEGKDGLALASDSRGTFGDPRNVTAQNDTIRKIYKITDYVGILTSGAGELSVSLMDELKKTVEKDKIDGVTQIMNKFMQVTKSKYSGWFSGFTIQPSPNSEKPNRPDVSVIIAGYDLGEDEKPSDKKIYILSSFLDFAPQRVDYGFALAGIPQYALYLLNRLYTKDKTIDELMHLAVYVITETASQDGKVGGPIKVLKITDKDKACELNDEEIAKILSSNIKRAKRLKESFFKKNK
jgi:20S proteasome alpha/beta subunit